MSVFRSLAHLLTELRRTLLAERVTVQFPFAPPDLPPEYRGIIVVADQDACKGCGLCTRDCPALALVLERYDKEQFRLIHYRDRCAYCGQCADNCPSNVIVLSNELVSSAPTRDTLVWVLVERRGDETGASEELQDQEA
jgi:formate hydrogenlyase subunit 6/NADH:ubiquinone oxidoreductase subunit I